jgi:hypothetical protein
VVFRYRDELGALREEVRKLRRRVGEMSGKLDVIMKGMSEP